jgi:hypothetical protein
LGQIRAAIATKVLFSSDQRGIANKALRKGFPRALAVIQPDFRFGRAAIE